MTPPKKEQKIKEVEVPFFVCETAERSLYEVCYSPSAQKSFFLGINSEGKAREPLSGYFQGRDKKGNEIRFVPANGNAVKEGAVILPEGAEEYESTEKLIEEVRAFIHKYCDVSEEYELFCTYYILLSWVYDRLNTIPYLRVLGDTGTGKTRFRDIVGKLCYKPITTSGAATPAVIFRMQGFWKGTLLIDEADRKKSDESDEVTKILNCGFEKGNPVLRCDKDKPNEIEIHDVYGPKIIGTRFSFYDQALESRCLTEVMHSTNRADIKEQLPPSVFKAQAQIRKKLLTYRLKNYWLVDPEKVLDIDMGNIEKRLKQGTLSFAVLLANSPPLLEKFKAFLAKYQEKLIEERADSIEGQIVDLLAGMTPEEMGAMTSKEIAEKLKEKHGYEKMASSTVGRRLKSLGFHTEMKKMAGRVKRWLVVDQEVLESMKKRYMPGYFFEEKTTNLVTEVTVVTDIFEEKTTNLVTEVTVVTDIAGEARKNNNLADFESHPHGVETVFIGDLNSKSGIFPLETGKRRALENNNAPSPVIAVTTVTPVTFSSPVLVCFLHEVLKFVATDMQEYGPFQPGQKAEIPEKTAGLLIRRGFAEAVETARIPNARVPDTTVPDAEPAAQMRECQVCHQLTILSLNSLGICPPCQEKIWRSPVGSSDSLPLEAR